MFRIKAAVMSAIVIISAATCSYAAGGSWDISSKYSWSPDKLHDKAKALADSSPYLSYELLGSSVEGREIYALTLSDDADNQTKDENIQSFSLSHNHTLHIAGTHSKEHMNPFMLFQMVENYVRDIEDNSVVSGYNVKKMLFEEKQALHFVVCVNPDGVNYVKRKGNISGPYRYKFGSGSSLKANMRGIDLNRNFPHTAYSAYLDAWFKLPNNSIYRPSSPGARNYGGKAGSEPETKALMSYIVKYPYKAMISFHSYGRIQYAGHRFVEGETYTQARRLSDMIRRVSGYGNGESLYVDSKGSSRGFETEYFTIMSGKPSITVETNAGESTRYAYSSETASRRLWRIPLETASLSKSFKSGQYKLYKGTSFFTSFASRNYAEAYARRYGLELVKYSGRAIDHAVATDTTPPVIRLSRDGAFIEQPVVALSDATKPRVDDPSLSGVSASSDGAATDSAAAVPSRIKVSIDDPNLANVAITKDGATIPVPEGYELSEPGSYMVTAYDSRNNRSELAFSVTE